jgi:hypothetical protein
VQQKIVCERQQLDDNKNIFNRWNLLCGDTPMHGQGILIQPT